MDDLLDPSLFGNGWVEMVNEQFHLIDHSAIVVEASFIDSRFGHDGLDMRYAAAGMVHQG